MRRNALFGGRGTDWQRQVLSLIPSWSGPFASRSPKIAPAACSIGLRFLHDADDRTVTVIDDVRVIDIQPLALRIIGKKVVEHRRLLATAVDRISTLPETPKSRPWKVIVAAQLEKLAQQDPMSEEFIIGSDQPLLFARCLADAAEALENRDGPPGGDPHVSDQTRPRSRSTVRSPSGRTCGSASRTRPRLKASRPTKRPFRPVPASMNRSASRCGRRGTWTRFPCTRRSEGPPRLHSGREPGH